MPMLTWSRAATRSGSVTQDGGISSRLVRQRALGQERRGRNLGTPAALALL
jgi:hypothetical protein